jgi:hypothetical protein
MQRAFTQSKLTKSIENAQKSRNLSGNADVLVPLTVYLVVRMNPPNLISNLRFIRRYRNSEKLQGEAAYYLTNMVDGTNVYRRLWCHFWRTWTPK